MPTIQRLFPGETVVCIATGPSLTAEDVNYVQGKARVIVVNDAYRLAPWGDVLWASDAKWYGWHQGVPSFTGLKYCLEGTKFPDVQTLKHTGKDGLELSPSAVKNGRNSGYAAINCAVHLGASRIILLGYDLQRGPKGEEHFFGKHPQPASSNYESFRQNYQTLVEPLKALNISIANCTRRSALNCFQRQSLEAVLSQREVAA